MKKYLLILSVALTIIGCDMPSTTEILIEPKSAKHTVKFQNNTITLSEGFAKMSPDEFKKRLDTIDNPKFKKVALEDLTKIQQKGSVFQLFVDSQNVENYVFVYSSNYEVLDEYWALKHVKGLSRKLKRESKKQKVRYKRIQGRYFFTPTSRIVKLKYLKAFKKDRKFQTEYIVASKSGGIGLLISNLKDVDFEESIKSLVLK